MDAYQRKAKDILSREPYARDRALIAIGWDKDRVPTEEELVEALRRFVGKVFMPPPSYDPN